MFLLLTSVVRFVGCRHFDDRLLATHCISIGGHGTKRRRNITENFNRLIRAHERYRRQTTGSERKHKFAKKYDIISFCSVSMSYSNGRRLASNRGHGPLGRGVESELESPGAVLSI